MRIHYHTIFFLVLCVSLLSVKSSFQNESNIENGDLTLLIEPSTLTVQPGSRGYAILLLSGMDDESVVSLKALNSVENVHLRFNPDEGRIRHAFLSLLTIEVGLNVTEGTYIIEVAAFVDEVFSKGNITLNVPTIDEIRTSTISDSQTSSNEGFILMVYPSSQELSGSQRTVKYSVTVISKESFNKKVILGVEGLPRGVLAIFNPKEGRPSPFFKSNLQIAVNYDVTPGTYTFSIYAIHGKAVQKANATLIIRTTTTTTATLEAEKKQLNVIAETNQLNYNLGEKVEIFGHVYSIRVEPASSVAVSIQVVDAIGSVIHSSKLKTAIGGYFSDEFVISSRAPPGTYTVFITASAWGFNDGFSRTVFTIEDSSEPSIVIDSVYTTSTDGSIKELFKPGETIIVWVLLNNTGADLEEGIVWVEVTDPRGMPVMVGALGSSINYLEQTKFLLQVKLNQNSPLGLYEINSLVSTGYISKGGKFIASKGTTFLVY